MKTTHADESDSTEEGASHPLLSKGAGDVRIGPIFAIPAVLAELGVKPQRAFDVAGVDLGLFQDPENRLGFEAVGRLLGTCVTLTNCCHFGLLVGLRFDLTGMGPIGYLIRHSPTIGDGLRSLLLHLHLHDKGAAPVLITLAPDYVVLGYSIYRHGTPATEHIYDAAIAIGYQILRELCGSSWHPMRVQFSYSQPSSTAPYRRLFGSSVLFDAEVSGIVFASSWLEKPIEGADAALHRILAQAIRDEEAKLPMSFSEQMEQVLHQMVLSGTATADSIARLFGIHERTLRRRLEQEGRNLQQLINQTRFELAQQLLQNTELPVTEIAAALQYADATAFSRAFRNWAQISPRQWRARQRGLDQSEAEPN